ncbi:dipeptidase [Microvirga alba]|uniref:Dipeptidase n=1 Tax=Microvirga alba TaxID=2791025 RepID=A0A931BSG3_9HYPH|nr:membrane dipeptidase [Microvirga alba]MBF9233823.1 dipeptidase [Microvirga alba]
MSKTAVRREAAKSTLKDFLVFDMLGGSLGTLGAPAGRPADYADGPLRAGIDVLHISIGTHVENIEPVLVELYDCLCLFDQMSHRALHVRSGADIETARQSGRVGVILGSQGLDYIGRETRLIMCLARLGLRCAALTYNEANALGSGCLEPTDHGLTLIGKRAVRELRHNGIALDLTHVGYRTSMDAMELYDGPAIFTHSNAYALTPNPRNIKDDQIRAAAATGGMVGVSPYSPFCHSPKSARPTVEDFANHIDYMVQLVGIDHVGIGTDLFPHTKVKWENGTKRNYPEMVGPYVWETVYSEGFDSQQKFETLPDLLARRGYTDADIRRIMGENAARVFAEAWDKAPADHSPASINAQALV